MIETQYIFAHGKLTKKDDSLLFTEDDGINKHEIPIYQLKDLYINIHNEITAPAKILMYSKGIIIHEFNEYEYYLSSTIPTSHMSSGRSIVNEVLFYTDIQKRLFIAKQILIGAFKNISRNTSYYNNRRDGIKLMDVNKYINKLNNSDNINVLMLVEAQFRKEYYSNFQSIMGVDEFVRDCPNSHDIINVLLNFINSLLYTVIFSEVAKTHISGEIGFIHEIEHNRYPLVYDISEIFKPILVDRLIFRLINRKQIKSSDLNGNGRLSEIAVKTIFEEWDWTLRTTFYYDKLKRHISYRILIREELYKLEKHLNGEKEYSPFVMR
jgi:CRISPR-associated protein Cas1